MQLFSAPPRNSYQPTVIPDDVPVYRVKDGKFFADDRLFESDKIIIWEEEPNLEMEPVNQMAVEKMKEFLAKLDKHGKAVAEKTSTQYTSYADAFENSMKLAKEEGKKVTVLNERTEVPLMGGKQNKKKKVREIEMQKTMEAPEVVNNKASVNKLVDETGLKDG